MNELERLNSIKRWLKGKKLPEAEKDIMRGLINLRKIELEKEARERIEKKVNKPTTDSKKNTEHLEG